jgi:hypothetical protein
VGDNPVVPASIDRSTPNPARIYDYFLGGKENYEADREVAQGVLDRDPSVRTAAKANRKFLKRAVNFLAGEAGITQFLDIGSGLPTQENVHEVAHQVNPSARIVYVDNDQTAVAHNRALLTAHTDTAVTVQGDLRQPEEILAHPETRRLIDFEQPVAVLLIAILHFIQDDEDPYRIVRTLMDAMPSGSWLVICHAQARTDREDAIQQFGKLYQRATVHGRLRAQAEILRFFDGLELAPPGLVPMTTWRPDTAVSDAEADAGRWALVGVAKKV